MLTWNQLNKHHRRGFHLRFLKAICQGTLYAASNWPWSDRKHMVAYLPGVPSTGGHAADPKASGGTENSRPSRLLESKNIKTTGLVVLWQHNKNSKSAGSLAFLETLRQTSNPKGCILQQRLHQPSEPKSERICDHAPSQRKTRQNLASLTSKIALSQGQAICCHLCALLFLSFLWLWLR